MCTLQYDYFATCALCNKCILHLHSAICIEPARQISRWISLMDELNRSAKQTSWTDQLDRPAVAHTSWTDQLDGPARRTTWTWMGQLSFFEALASSHIWRLTFRFVLCHSFRVWRRPCFGTQVFFWPKSFFEPQIFLGATFFFRTTNIFCTQICFGPKIF